MKANSRRFIGSVGGAPGYSRAMAFFAVTYTYVDDAERIAATRPRHRDFLAQLVEQGVLVASGPLPETSPPSALLILKGESEPDVRRALSVDPFQEQGIVTACEVQPWQPVVGCFAAEVVAG